jgi:WD40 repeat protein
MVCLFTTVAAAWMYCQSLPEPDVALQRLEQHPSPACCLAFSPDGKALICGGGLPHRGGELTLLDFPSGQLRQLFVGVGKGIRAVAISPSGKLVAIGGLDQEVRLLDLATGHECAVLEGHCSEVLDVCFSSDGKVLVSRSNDEEIRLWRLPDSKEATSLKGYSAMALAPTGQTLAVASTARPAVILLDSHTGRELSRLPKWPARITCLSFSPTGALLAGGTTDGSVALWDMAAGRWGPRLSGHTSLVTAVAFAPDGGTVATASLDQTVRLWDVTTGREKAVLCEHTGPVNALAYSVDGQVLASASDCNVLLWEVARPMKRARP